MIGDVATGVRGGVAMSLNKLLSKEKSTKLPMRSVASTDISLAVSIHAALRNMQARRVSPPLWGFHSQDLLYGQFLDRR